MGRLFWKIFLWFWFTMILMTLGIAWGMAQFFQREEGQISRHLSRVAMPQMAAVMSVLKSGGEPAARALLREAGPEAPVSIYVFDERGRELLSRPLPDSAHSLERRIRTPDGRRYRLAMDIAARHRPPPRMRAGPLFPPVRNPLLFWVRLGLAVLVSGLVCFWLAWYLAKPVRQLRRATLRLSEGDLETRVAPAIGRRRDEIADLSRDFDRMAERIQALILTQKQLLGDVSHELRSPLARLQVALELARKKSEGRAEAELARIGREADRLDELIGQVLTLVRLETETGHRGEDYVDVAVLLEEIIRDARFEATGSEHRVELRCDISPTLRANTELLRRALENVIRNAIRYTEEETAVEVKLQADPERQGWIRMSVCDRGPGVPESLLPTLFEPFVRVGPSRSRDSGGYGLGLAIARRAILSHGGAVTARNRTDGGLCISVRLPLEFTGPDS